MSGRTMKTADVASFLRIVTWLAIEAVIPVLCNPFIFLCIVFTITMALCGPVDISILTDAEAA